MIATLTRPETAPLIGLVRTANRDLARLMGSVHTGIDSWKGRPLEELSEEELLEALDRLNSTAGRIREGRSP